MMPAAPAKPLCPVGTVTRTHGQSGSVRVRITAEKVRFKVGEPVFVRLGQGPVPFFVRSAQEVGHEWELSFDHVDDEAYAMRLVRCEVLVYGRQSAHKQDDDLEQLVGWKVTDPMHGDLGTISSIMEMKAHAVLVVDHNGTEVLIPAVEPIIEKIDKRKRTVQCALPDGLLELYVNA